MLATQLVANNVLVKEAVGDCDTFVIVSQQNDTAALQEGVHVPMQTPIWIYLKHD